MRIQAIRGVKDIMPDEIEKWRWVENKANQVFTRYGFKEIRLPIFEKTKLFSRGIGETTDIVEKEMYTFEDRGGEKVTLRPEGTASVVRAFIEHKMYTKQTVQKYYYLGPMFRYERPQAGRFRQFYQIGVEAMGSHNPSIDAEVMIMLMEFFTVLGLNQIELQINSLGCNKCRPEYRETLKKSITNHLADLCENCNKRYQKNPLRVLDCKVERDIEIASGLPKITDHICNECKCHFEKVQTLLHETQIPYNINPSLVRGLDYYTHTAFEVTSRDLGAQNAISGGGRYNTLVEEFEGPPTPCFGFALGLERLISLVPFDKMESIETNPDVFVVSLGEEAKLKVFSLVHQLRSGGISVERDYNEGSIKSQMRKANRSASSFALIIGENEIKSGTYQLKNMKDGKQSNITAESCVEEIKALIN
ncbi:MAG: histidine--tRNA ligase [Nitrospina sp.]|jgi:histidyl-tRNA synthetase|nr:histidine--tRNA ligase [Nitrospina sp.]MBT5986259.1 histidine--tRNA ligase [Nitrospina sp.]